MAQFYPEKPKTTEGFLKQIVVRIMELLITHRQIMEKSLNLKAIWQKTILTPKSETSKVQHTFICDKRL